MVLLALVLLKMVKNMKNLEIKIQNYIMMHIKRLGIIHEPEK